MFFSLFEGPMHEIFVAEFLTQTKPVWVLVGSLGTRQKS
jgi:hypothetical protein